MDNKKILGRLYNDYTKKFLGKIIIAAFFSILIAGSTSSIAWLLDPAIEKIFVEKNQKLIFIIPMLIVIAFTTKGISLYLAKSTMIGVGEEVKKMLQQDMLKSFIQADTQLIENKHTIAPCSIHEIEHHLLPGAPTKNKKYKTREVLVYTIHMMIEKKEIVGGSLAAITTPIPVSVATHDCPHGVLTVHPHTCDWNTASTPH